MTLDVHTSDTLRQMVRYLKWSDAQIARYLDIGEAQVRAARGYVPRTRQKASGQTDQRDYAGAGDLAFHRDAARRGSERLLAALGRAGAT